MWSATRNGHKPMNMVWPPAQWATVVFRIVSHTWNMVNSVAFIPFRTVNDKNSSTTHFHTLPCSLSLPPSPLISHSRVLSLTQSLSSTRFSFRKEISEWHPSMCGRILLLLLLVFGSISWKYFRWNKLVKNQRQHRVQIKWISNFYFSDNCGVLFFVFAMSHDLLVFPPV